MEKEKRKTFVSTLLKYSNKIFETDKVSIDCKDSHAHRKLISMTVFLEQHLSAMYMISMDGVGVEISSGIKPKVELLFSIALAMAEDICVKDVRITT
ncbi:hypothetical protein CFP56_037055 [Quercus suber]|uniref:Uncharacterized protein n=1 Tax=Quercus suber TaxID=58331 RepID=A0AAW0J5C2_QUESU